MNKGVQNLTNKPRPTGNVTVYELLISSLTMTDALAKLLIEKGLITREEFMQKISEETSDVSEAAKSDAAMIRVTADPPFHICGCIHRVDELMSGKEEKRRV